MSLPASIDAAFPAAVVAEARPLSIDPVDLLEVLNAESDVTPTAHRPGGAVGMNQFVPSTLAMLRPPISPDDYARLPASVQLSRYIAPWWRAALASHNALGVPLSARDLYWLNFVPSEFRPGVTDDAYHATDNAQFAHDNQALSHGKPYVTLGDLDRFLDDSTHRNPSRWFALVDAVRAAEADQQLSARTAGPRRTIGLGLLLVGAVAVLKVWR